MEVAGPGTGRARARATTIVSTAAAAGHAATTLAGYPAQCREPDDQPHCLVELDDLVVRVVYDGAVDELAKVVSGMATAAWDDPSTWYDLDDALP